MSISNALPDFKELDARFEVLLPDRPEPGAGSEEFARRQNLSLGTRSVSRGEQEADQELLGSLLAGDRAASVRFVLRFERLIHRQLHDLRVPEQDHADLFQDVFLHLWEEDCRRLRHWKGRGMGIFSSYLRVVVRRLIYDALRSRAALSPLAPISPEWEKAAEDPESLLLARERQVAIMQTMETLSERDRELIGRRHMRGETYREMAAGMGLTVSHVGVALARAEQHMKKAICTRYPDLFAKV